MIDLSIDFELSVVTGGMEPPHEPAHPEKLIGGIPAITSGLKTRLETGDALVLAPA